jgi:hypothetical protein
VPYDVHGWDELEIGDSAVPLLALAAFVIYGDAISATVFGVGKAPRADAPLAGRGPPDNPSSVVQAEIDLYAEHGLAWTWAFWPEVRAAPASPDAPSLDDSPWRAVVEAVEALCRIDTTPRGWAIRDSQIRVVVYGVW